MPFYEYQCGACGHKLEALQKMSDDPLVYCPECNEAALKKLISAAAFHLKGTGWYETDFKNNGKKPDGETSKANGSQDSTGGDGASASSSAAASPAKSETKSAAKSNPGQSASAA